MIKKIALSGFVIFFGLMLGRILGLVRDMYLASKFGTTIESDILIIILTVPDAIFSLIASGAISASLIPEFKKISREDGVSLLLISSLLFFIFSILIILTLNSQDGLLVNIFSPGISIEYSLLLQEYLSKVNWLIPLTILAGVSTAFLHSKDKFFISSIGSAIINMFILIGLFLTAKNIQNLDILIAFILIGGSIRWLSQLWIIRKDLLLIGKIKFQLINKYIFHRYFYAVLSGGLLILYPVVARSFASFSEEGSISIVNYSLKLVEVPANVAVTVLSIVILPKLSQMLIEKKRDKFKEIIQFNLFWSLAISSAITGAVIAQSNTFIESIFGLSGKITEQNIEVMSTLLMVGILSLPFQALIAVSTSVFYSEKNTKTPMIINSLGFILLIILNLINIHDTNVYKIVTFVLISYVITGLIFIIKLDTKHNIVSMKFISLALSAGGFSYIASYFLGYINLSLYINLLFLIFIVCIVLATFMMLTKKYFVYLGYDKT
jgi:putative peptidoglycan lipid II flippase